jgi:LmbE family N-acetylglucosaminyl deacetylase
MTNAVQSSGLLSAASDDAERPRPVIVVSPHLDDAVFGCGELLAMRPGSVVVTVFAGAPPTYETVTEWDALAGFRPGDDVMAARRAEDARALALLGARPIWLDFRDSQYRHTPTVPQIADALERVIGESGLRSVFIPLGLFHSDHHLTHAAARMLMRRRPDLCWVAYEEAMYRRIPNIVAERITALHEAGIAATPVETSAMCGRAVKERAIACYTSQLRALAAPKKPGYADALAAERYWSLAPPTPPERGGNDAL